MSVTFTPSKGTVEVRTYYPCDCADEAAMTHDVNCEDCNGTGVVSYTNDFPSMNVASANAKAMLAALGLPTEDDSGSTCGTIKNSDMLALRSNIVSKAQQFIWSPIVIEYVYPLMQIINCAIAHGADINYA